MRRFDVVVVGGGPAGEEASGRLAERGLSVALVEDRAVGGECAHWACMPSKALLRPYEALAEARRIAGAREAANGGLDVAAVLRRRDDIIGVDRDGGAPGDAALMPWLQSKDITLIRGRGRLAGERRVSVGDEQLEARLAVILAGGSLPLSSDRRHVPARPASRRRRRRLGQRELGRRGRLRRRGRQSPDTAHGGDGQPERVGGVWHRRTPSDRPAPDGHRDLHRDVTAVG